MTRDRSEGKSWWDKPVSRRQVLKWGVGTVGAALTDRMFGISRRLREQGTWVLEEARQAVINELIHLGVSNQFNILAAAVYEDKANKKYWSPEAFTPTVSIGLLPVLVREGYVFGESYDEEWEKYAQRAHNLSAPLVSFTEMPPKEVIDMLQNMSDDSSLKEALVRLSPFMFMSDTKWKNVLKTVPGGEIPAKSLELIREKLGLSKGVVAVFREDRSKVNKNGEWVLPSTMDLNGSYVWYWVCSDCINEPKQLTAREAVERIINKDLRRANIELSSIPLPPKMQALRLLHTSSALREGMREGDTVVFDDYWDLADKIRKQGKEKIYDLSIYGRSAPPPVVAKKIGGQMIRTLYQ